MPNPAPNRLPAIPLAIWVQHALENLSREYDGARGVLALRLGISERQVFCWERSQNSEGEPVFNFKAETIEDALTHGEIGMWEVFPGFEFGIADIPREGFCTACDEVVGATAKGRCVWCNGPVSRGANLAERIVRRHRICPICRGPKGERSLRCKSCSQAEMKERSAEWFSRRGASECSGCGGKKARDATVCLKCYREGGGPRGIRQVKGLGPALMSEELLQEARVLYETPMPMSEVADKILSRTGYASTVICRQSLGRQFRRRGWPIRSRGEVNRLKVRAPEAIAALGTSPSSLSILSESPSMSKGREEAA